MVHNGTMQSWTALTINIASGVIRSAVARAFVFNSAGELIGRFNGSRRGDSWVVSGKPKAANIQFATVESDPTGFNLHLRGARGLVGRCLLSGDRIEIVLEKPTDLDPTSIAVAALAMYEQRVRDKFSIGEALADGYLDHPY